MTETTEAAPTLPEAELHEADFADMHLKVGDTLIMQPLTGHEAEPFSVSFIGAHGRQSFITSLPLIGDKGIWVTPGSSFKFRVVHGIYAYAFTSRSLRARSRPYPYAHFEVPASVKYRQIRESQRLDMRFPVEVVRANGTRTLAILRDISQHGARLELTGFLDEVAAEISLTIPIILPELATSITLSATIRNHSDSERSIALGRFIYGVRFNDLAPESSGLLQHFIEHLLVEQLA